MSEQNWEEWVQGLEDEHNVNLEQEVKQTEKQKKILEAAIEIFAEKGFNGASTSEIAQKAGVAEATIFKHYRTKKGLLLRLVIPAIGKVAKPFIIQSLLDILDQDEPLEVIIPKILKDRMDFLEKHWPRMKVIIIEAVFHDEIREAIRNHVLRNIFSVVSERLDQLKGQGKIRKNIPNHVLVRSILSMGLGYLLFRTVAPGILVLESEEEEIDMTSKVIIDGIASSQS